MPTISLIYIIEIYINTTIKKTIANTNSAIGDVNIIV